MPVSPTDPSAANVAADPGRVPVDGRVIVRVRDLVCRYGEHTILDGVGFDIRAGEIFGIVGGSGCGKTTLVRHIIGLDRAVSGTIEVDGIDVAGGDENDLDRVRRKIGMAFQGGALFASLTVAENIALALEEFTALPQDIVHMIVSIKLDMVNLAGTENLEIAQLSGGMKKRAGLARAMALDPEILCFDEPSAGLDPVTSIELDELIVQINRSLHTTIIVVSHELPSILEIADRVIMLDDEEKKIIAEGSPRELREHSTDPRVHAFFNRLPRDGGTH